MPDPRKQWKAGKSLALIAGNPDGTIDGLKALSAISGLDAQEVAWTFNRLKALIANGKTVDQAVAAVKAEGAKKPWLAASANPPE